MKLLVENSIVPLGFVFLILFKYLIVFTVTTLQRTKPGSLKEWILKLIMAIFGISDHLERVVKIVTKFDSLIYTVLLLCQM